MMEEQQRVEKARKPKAKKGRSRNAPKKAKKVNNSASGDDAGGYKVSVVQLVTLLTGVYCASINKVVYLIGLMACLLALVL